jgi:hypothetical protein
MQQTQQIDEFRRELRESGDQTLRRELEDALNEVPRHAG